MAIHLDALPGGRAITGTLVWQRARHHLALLGAPRVNSSFTGFLRLPTQYEALTGPVVDLARRHRDGAPLSVVVLGCSNGAEAYSIASCLGRRHPDLAFDIRAYDIDPECVRAASAARYTHDEVFNNTLIEHDFVDATFDRTEEGFVVKPAIAARVSCAVGDVLSDRLMAAIGPSDIVFAQNFLFHLRRPLARQALRNVFRLLRPGSAVFIDGVDLDLRQRLVRRRGLQPLDYKIREIHDEARRARSVGWPYEVPGGSSLS